MASNDLHFYLATEVPATVIAVHYDVGQPVRGGEPVALLESMKMEIPVLASESGTVTAIHAAVGSFVRAGEVIISLRGA